METLSLNGVLDLQLNIVLELNYVINKIAETLFMRDLFPTQKLARYEVLDNLDHYFKEFGYESVVAVDVGEGMSYLKREDTDLIKRVMTAIAKENLQELVDNRN